MTAGLGLATQGGLLESGDVDPTLVNCK